MRNRMARWMGVSLDVWDGMSYPDQCDAIEIARAERENERYDAAQARAKAARQARHRGRRR